MVSPQDIIQHSPHLRPLGRRLQVFWQTVPLPEPVEPLQNRCKTVAARRCGQSHQVRRTHEKKPLAA